MRSSAVTSTEHWRHRSRR